MQVPFIGPSYQLRSLNVDAQRSINLYPELVESQDGKNTYSLVGTPGIEVFCNLPNFPIRGHHDCLGRLFVVAGNGLYEVFEDGTFIQRGTLLTASYYVGMDDNGLQLCIVDGDNEYIFTLADNTFVVNPAGDNFFGSNTVSFIDGYFVFVEPASNKFFLSALNDGTSISDLDVAEKEGNSDFIVHAKNDHRQLYVFGTQTTEPWYDQGSTSSSAVTFPFAPIPGVFIESGLAAAFSLVKHDNALMYLGQDARGSGIVYRMQGFAPMRVSTHAIEKIIQSWGDLSSAVAYSYQEEGHTFYCLNSPQGKTTVCYDSATEQWHERQFNNPGDGTYTRHRANFYSFIFNKHIMGDWQNGSLYLSSLDTYTDSGRGIHRIRISPHLFNDLKQLFFKFFQVDMEAGVGTDGTNQGNNPQMMMSYSNDGGHTYIGERWVSMGRIGKTKARAFWNKCGSARDRVWKIKITDPVKVVLIDAKIEASEGRS